MAPQETQRKCCLETMRTAKQHSTASSAAYIYAIEVVNVCQEQRPAFSLHSDDLLLLTYWHRWRLILILLEVAHTRWARFARAGGVNLPFKPGGMLRRLEPVGKSLWKPR